MEKRLPLALILSFAFALLVMNSFPPPKAPERAGTAVDSPGQGSGTSDAADPGRAAAADAAPSVAAPPRAVLDEAADDSVLTAPPSPPPPVSDAPLLTEVLQTSTTRARWTSRGAALSQLDLLQYHPSLDSDEELPLLSSLDGEQDNLLLRDLRGVYGLDLVNWELTRESLDDGLARLVFSHTTADGLRFTRTVTQRPGDYVFDLQISVTNEGETPVRQLSLALESARGLVDLSAGKGKFRYGGGPKALAIVRDKLGEHDVTDWSGSSLDGDPRPVAADERLLIAGVMTNYFASVLMPAEGTDVRQVFPSRVFDALALDREVAARQPRDEQEAEALRTELASDFRNNAAASLSLVVLGLDPGETESFGFQVYAGPKSSVLAGQPGYDFLHEVIEASYGWFAWINRSLLLVLRFFHSIVGNWGVAIILLTVVVKGLLFPLNRKQQTGMTRYSAAMQRLKPRLDELKKKYKNNTRKFQEEQMKLLKAEGVSPPLGGCLLMFLQFPVWISLFRILGTSIELRQSSFVGWITDLSLPDQMPFGFFGFETINLLPILMSAATIAQMRFQPKPGDDSQAQTQKIMGMIMPIFMLWILYRYSAGLSLYILTSSLLGIFEYQVIRRIWPLDGASGGSPAAAKA